MEFVPEPLVRRFGEEQGQMLDQAVGVVCRELVAAYDRNAREFDPSVGDNAHTFATNVLHHSRYGVAQQLGERVEIEVLESGLAWRLQVGETTLRVYKMGSVAPSDIRMHRLDPRSMVKRQMAEDNSAEMQQVLDLAAALPPQTAAQLDAGFAPNELAIVHFGNDKGLAALFWGAPLELERAGSFWAWVQEVELPVVAAAADFGTTSSDTDPVAAEDDERDLSFDERDEPELDLDVRDEPDVDQREEE
jgi:hypothetical protein